MKDSNPVSDYLFASFGDLYEASPTILRELVDSAFEIAKEESDSAPKVERFSDHHATLVCNHVEHSIQLLEGTLPTGRAAHYILKHLPSQHWLSLYQKFLFSLNDNIFEYLEGPWQDFISQRTQESSVFDFTDNLIQEFIKRSVYKSESTWHFLSEKTTFPEMFAWYRS